LSCEKNLMGYSILMRGLGETDSWKKLKSKISWHLLLLTPPLDDTIKRPRFFSKYSVHGFFLA
jgi:hypothetical protein